MKTNLYTTKEMKFFWSVIEWNGKYRFTICKNWLSYLHLKYLKHQLIKLFAFKNIFKNEGTKKNILIFVKFVSTMELIIEQSTTNTISQFLTLCFEGT